MKQDPEEDPLAAARGIIYAMIAGALIWIAAIAAYYLTQQ